MSYSFSVQGKTREELGVAVRERLDDVEKNQPVHTELHDVHQTVVQLCGAMRNLEADERYNANVYGSCWWQESKDGFQSVDAHVQLSIVKAAAAPGA